MEGPISQNHPSKDGRKKQTRSKTRLRLLRHRGPPLGIGVHLQRSKEMLPLFPMLGALPLHANNKAGLKTC
jgi:hypothetical protein